MSWNKSWKASVKPRKQRAYVYQAPSHIQGAVLASHLSADLRKKHNTRSMRVRKGDKIKVMSGQFKGKTGPVERVDVARKKVYVTGVEHVKKDGGKFIYGLHPSNLMITELHQDRRRMKK
ncbi:50S ribosomal protein L24 [Candidatus Woesearchaeota archaeon]|nr:50S ribosomal protein L24 [Candidatus Woesearchaeota archaeon]